ncbi:12775_t:CDS:2, partial [Acaulospora morrowiae]
LQEYNNIRRELAERRQKKEVEEKILEEVSGKDTFNTRTIKDIPKTIYYRKFSPSSILANSAKENHKITSYFGTVEFSVMSSVSSMPLVYSEKLDNNMLCKKIAQLQETLLKNRQIFTAIEYNERRAVYKYFIQLNDGNNKLKANEEA